MIYNKFSDYLKNKYGSKVYKLPVNLCSTCPNRTGTKVIAGAEAGAVGMAGAEAGAVGMAGAEAGAVGMAGTEAGVRAGARAGTSSGVGTGGTGAEAGAVGMAGAEERATAGKVNSTGATAAGTGGCIFCGDEGAGFEMLSPDISVRSQLEGNRRYIGDKYGADKFIAYFQNYSNTYLPFDIFCRSMEEACADSVVALYISTRPDCIDDKRIKFLRQLKEAKGVDIEIELGLQSINPATLRWLNRRHGLAEFIDAVLRIKSNGLGICAHMITDIPMDDIFDVVEGAKLLSSLGIDQVKCHSLYVLENTVLGELYKANAFKPLQMDEFIERTISFLEYLNPEIVVQRLIGRAPADRTLFCNWNTSWWKIHDMIVEKMQQEGRYQGRLFDYLNGSALKGLR